ncbi:hypothetical protein ABZ652_13760 [Micromonospora chalcea]
METIDEHLVRQLSEWSAGAAAESPYSVAFVNRHNSKIDESAHGRAGCGA